MDKKSRNTIIISIVALAIVLITVTYAYFSARITGIESASTISLSAGTMTIVYAEGNEEIIMSGIYPRDEAWVIKTFTLIGNNSTAIDMEYEVGLNITANTFKGGQLTYSLESGENNVGISMSVVEDKSLIGQNRIQKIGRGSFPGATTNGIQEYTLKIFFKDNGLNQNINQGAVFSAKIVVSEKIYNVTPNNCIDTEHSTLAQGDEYVNGQYTYRYKQRKLSNAWGNSTIDGWGVALTDKDSTDAVTTKLCTSINGKPIVNMSYMFTGSQATSIDLSSFDTSNVVSMAGMFSGASANQINISNLDTSKVESMEYMFSANKATSININNIDTSNVTNMNYLFRYAKVTSLDLTSFDTSNVNTMKEMFYNCDVSSIDVSSFRTSSVSYMNSMFESSKVTVLDLRTFDTSNVTNMESMFRKCYYVTNIDVSNFKTTNVTNMQNMFASNFATTLDLSSFDVSNVSNTTSMFASSRATTGYARTQTDANILNNTSDKPAALTFVVK